MKPIACLLLIVGFASAAEIHEAAAAGDLNRITALVKQDAAILKLDDDAGNEPLHHAAKARKLDALQLLIRLGSDVNAANRDGLRPIHLASKNGPTEAVDALINAGARVDFKSAAGRTPLDMAAHELIRRRIRAAINEVPGTSDFFKVAESGQIAALDALVAKSPSLTKVVDSNGDTALIRAVIKRQSAVARWLLDHDSSLNTMDRIGRTALYHACAHLDEELVSLLLKAGADANACGEDVAPPLVDVMSMFHLPGERSEILPEITTYPLVERMAQLSSQQDLEAVLQEIEAPLHTDKQAAAIHRLEGMLKRLRAQITEVPKMEQALRLRMARQLLDHKANPDKSGKAPWSALVAAALSSDPAGVKLLLDHGADVNAQGFGGTTALIMAVSAGRLECVDSLLGAKAKANARTILSALKLAVLMGDKATLRHLVDRTKPWRDDISSDEELAAIMGWKSDSEVIQLLLAAGVNPNLTGDLVPYGPLHAAAALTGSRELLKLLLDAGAPLEKKDSQGYSPLHCAVEDGRTDNVRFLIERGANVAAPALDGRTPLHSAAQTGHVEILRLLIERGAAVNATERNGATALMFAAIEGRPEAVEFLLSHGADPNHESRRGLCALDSAATGGVSVTLSSNDPGNPPRDYGRCAELLIKAGAHLEHESGQQRGRTALGIAAENGVLPVVEVLLRHGASIDNTAQDASGRKPLHRAAHKGHAAVVRALIKAGGKDGITKMFEGVSAHAMHWAAENNHVETLTALLDGGADVNARAFDQSTPLMWAEQRGMQEAAALLLQRGADVHASANGGGTALSNAITGGHPVIVKLLLRAGAMK